jgi:hypothetical protein
MGCENATFQVELPIGETPRLVLAVTQEDICTLVRVSVGSLSEHFHE